MREMIYKSTKHAAKRTKERVGISKKIADENAIRAHQNGVPAKDIGGGLRRYLDSLYLRSKSINEIVVYNCNVYLFAKEMLVTIIPLPQKYRTKAVALQRKRSEQKE